MNGGRPGVLRIGDRVVLSGVRHTVTGLAGTLVHLADERNRTSVVSLPDLLLQAKVESGPAPSLPRLPSARFHGLPAKAVEDASWWEPHIIEVLTGLPAGAPPGARPTDQYDPATRSLAEREAAKAAELIGSGHAGVSSGTVRRKRLRYQAQGVVGLVDGRADRARPSTGKTDSRVVDVLRRVLKAEKTVQGPSRTVEFFRWRVEQILESEFGPNVVPLPSRATFYRLFRKLSAGQHTTGSARTRRSLAGRPQGPFGQVTPVRPGELMQIDSTALDVLVRLDSGTPGRVDLTAVIDVATRTVTAAVLRPATKSVDASLLLARTVTPEPMRPGWADALRMSRSVLPFVHLHGVDERLAHAAARPVIVPESMVCDHGMVFISDNFRSSCRWLGIDFQPGHLGTPTDKPHIERMIGTVGTQFLQYVSGYLGSSVERRGRDAAAQPLWSLPELQDLLDEWIVACWQNRPHDGLRDPVSPGRSFSPNEKYATLIQAAGYVPLALSGEDYIELLPAKWRAINAYGVKINHRVYDDAQLNGLRRQPSGVTDRKDLWEVHTDPYDVTRIWVRNHHHGGWITLFWKHLSTAPAPFGELLWNSAISELHDSGVMNPAEDEIAEVVGKLLQRAHDGPPGASAEKTPPRRKRRRPNALGRPAVLDKSASHSRLPEEPAFDERETDQPYEDDFLADVVPLGIFDARKEAERRW
ncbi:Mu transposase C-terminal domain-containing protein [Streptomyces sp. NPDC007027]|uniref:Mu transposase C-terminal domain-containing protein n=1 Tax=Streptomyces sp. NPDC007027 TaxID=3157086 RepID=UPI0034544948